MFIYILKVNPLAFIVFCSLLMDNPGSRDPYALGGAGAGFVMEWTGNPKFTIGFSAGDKELLQLRSRQMYLAIPE